MDARMSSRERVREGPSGAYVSLPPLATINVDVAGLRGVTEGDISEEDGSYRWAVARLNDPWRVVEGKCGIQWVLQCWGGKRRWPPYWRGRRFCRRRAGLLNSVRDLCGAIGMDTRQASPNGFSEAPDA